MSEAIISLVDAASVASLFGVRDQHLRRLHDAFGASSYQGELKAVMKELIMIRDQARK